MREKTTHDDKSEFFTSFSLLNLGSHFIRLIP
jgi:hypothetical protein